MNLMLNDAFGRAYQERSIMSMPSEQNDSFREKWLARLMAITGAEQHQIQFIGTEDAVALYSKFHEFAEDSNDIARLYVTRKEFPVIRSVLQALERTAGSTKGVLLVGQDRINVVGCVLIELRHVLHDFPRLWSFLGEDLCFVTSDFSFGFRLEINYIDQRGRSYSGGFFELALWGSQQGVDSSLMYGAYHDYTSAHRDLSEWKIG
jgi:hypothetical protein